MMAIGVHCGRVYKRGSDKYGRFTWMALRGKDNTGIIVVTAYRPCRTLGENTSYIRQWQAFRNAGVSDPDPRQSVLDAISEVLIDWGNKGFQPLVMMDANATINERAFEQFLSSHGLCDLIDETNEGVAPRTYINGPDRLDYILGQESLKEAIVKSGSLETHGGVSLSDHTLQFLDIDCKAIFRSTKTNPIASYEREFQLSDKKQAHGFTAKLESTYKHQKIPKRVRELN